jgi:[ribosomal protein S18]-alanine N-acetyltransferase
VLIRAASPDDVPQMRALEQQADTAAHWAAREYDALFATDTPVRIALVAVGESNPKEIYGFVIARCAPEDWGIENVVVESEHRRRGVAAKLLQTLLLRASEANATSVLLEVRASNLPARRLYEKLGFSQHGRRSNYYHDPLEDGLLLQISIKSGEKVP